MLYNGLTIGRMSLSRGLWIGIAEFVFVWQNRSRCFVASSFPISQVFTLKGDGVLEALLCCRACLCTVVQLCAFEASLCAMHFGLCFNSMKSLSIVDCDSECYGTCLCILGNAIVFWDNSMDCGTGSN